jgi:hypothetical protein
MIFTTEEQRIFRNRPSRESRRSAEGGRESSGDETKHCQPFPQKREAANETRTDGINAIKLK